MGPVDTQTSLDVVNLLCETQTNSATARAPAQQLVCTPDAVLGIAGRPSSVLSGLALSPRVGGRLLPTEVPPARTAVPRLTPEWRGAEQRQALLLASQKL